ncbi:uncharacterized protein LOC117169830 [Belonocnema kinseyi]|uniref:uncharacterized protein LOC117169830 n=1 Tax=Belonocnema kinseyi TaxID=2817044 RepID=UPI00143D917D|nr:uncharacterized protein LOC117169830 [Belonocnema kinseyi]
MEKHLNTMLDLVDKLAAIGRSMDKDMIVSLILISLPESYSTLITALLSHLVENHQVNCFFCKEAGHLKRDCSKYIRWKANKWKEQARKACDVQDSANVCFLTKVKEIHNSQGDWFIYSGASSHMMNDRRFFSDLTNLGSLDLTPIKTTVQVAKKGIRLEVHGVGSGVINCLDGCDNPVTITVKVVFYVPLLDENLLSVKKMTQKGFEVSFSNTECRIKRDDKTLALGHSHGNLYKLDTLQAVYSAAKEEHHKDNCAILGLMHTDVCGPMQTVTPGNKWYILAIIDVYSRFIQVYLMKHKNEATPLIKDYIALILEEPVQSAEVADQEHKESNDKNTDIKEIESTSNSEEASVSIQDENIEVDKQEKRGQSGRVNKGVPPNFYTAGYIATQADDEPRGFKEAMHSVNEEEWRKAAEEELLVSDKMERGRWSSHQKIER